MKQTLTVIFYLLTVCFSQAQTVTLTDLKGVWQSNIHKDDYYIFFDDSLASLGIDFVPSGSSARDPDGIGLSK